MEFPLHSGQGIDTWLLKVEHYFTLDVTPEAAKVTMASMHLDEEGFQWHVTVEWRWLVFMTWAEYKSLLRLTFGQPHETPMIDPTHLHQTGLLHDLNVKFDSILAKLDLPEQYLVNAYMGALKDEICIANIISHYPDYSTLFYLSSSSTL